MLVSVEVPTTNTRGPLFMDQVLAAVHQGNPRRLPVTLGLTRHTGEVMLCCRFPVELRAIVEGQLYAQYPDAKISLLPEDALEPAAATSTWEVELHLHHNLFPIRRYAQFEDQMNRQSADPLTALLTAIAVAPDSAVHAAVEITVRPAGKRRVARARKSLRMIARPYFRQHHRMAKLYMALAGSRRWPVRFLGWGLGRVGRRSGPPESKSLDTSGSRLHEREDDLQAAADKLGKLLFETTIHLWVTGVNEQEAQQKLREIVGAFGQFNSPRLASFRAARMNRRHNRRPRDFLFSTEELATLWHPATLSVRAPTMTTVESRELEPPPELPTPERHADLAVLGVTAFRGRRQRFGILPDDRRRHVAIVGKTGMGKTTLLQQLISSDIRAHRGVALLDPHGDLCEAVLASIPPSRTNEVVLFDAGDITHPLSFNPLYCPRPEQRPLVASGVVSAFKKLYGEFWGPRLEHILRNALLALLEVPGSTLLSVLRLLSDARYRQPLVARLQDPVVRTFWQNEFASMPLRLQLEAIAPIQNKVGAFVSSPLLRNILGQSRSSLDLRQVLDEGRVLLVNLSKGRLGDDVSALLGSFLVTGLQLAAMSRADVPEEERRDFYLYVDEFQNFATDSFATILSEARKYRLNLTIANQYLAQLDEATAAAVFGNIGTMVCFQCGAQDAETLAGELGSDLTPSDLLTLPRFQAYVRLLIDGHPSRPFSLQTLAPRTGHDPRRPDIIRRYSRQRYARPVTQVEQEIERAIPGIQ